MKNKKNFTGFLIGIVVLLILLVLVLLLLPSPLISSPYQLSEVISSDSDVIVTSVFYDGEDVTDDIDHTALLEILSRYSRRFAFGAPSIPYSTEDAWEINLNQGGQPLHIVVGETAFCYQDTKTVFRIVDGEALLQELLNQSGH